MEFAEPGGIATQCARVARLMDSLVETMTTTQNVACDLDESELLDEQDRFLIWTGNVGPITDLDERLSQAPQVQQHLIRVLTRLENSVERVSIAEGSVPNKVSTVVDGQNLEAIESLDISDDDLSSVDETDRVSSSDDHPVHEFDVLRRAIRDTITNLFRMSETIKTPTPRGRYESSSSGTDHATTIFSTTSSLEHDAKGQRTEDPPSTKLSPTNDPKREPLLQSLANLEKDVLNLESSLGDTKEGTKENTTAGKTPSIMYEIGNEPMILPKKRSESDGMRTESSLGQVHSQRRFSRTHLEHGLTDDQLVPSSGKAAEAAQSAVSADEMHGQVNKKSKKHSTTHDFMDTTGRSSQSDFVSRGQWIEDVEKTDTSIQLPSAEIQILQNKIQHMQRELQKLERRRNSQVEKQYQILYRFGGASYLDHPKWSKGHIVSRTPVGDLYGFLEKNKSIGFLVYRDFDVVSSRKKQIQTASSPPKKSRENVRLINRRLRKSFERILAQDWRYESQLQHLRRTGEISAPFLFFYHHRRYWMEIVAQFPVPVRESLNIFATYVSENYGEEYKVADALFARREISIEMVKYFFQPGDILISRAAGQYRGYIANSWPQYSASMSARAPKQYAGQPAVHGHGQTQWSSSEDDESDIDATDVDSDDDEQDPEAGLRNARMRSLVFGNRNKNQQSASVGISGEELAISVYKWSFDGEFKREADRITLRLPRPVEVAASKSAAIWSIDNLEIYPISFARPDIMQRLQTRGRIFWECRKRRLISYRETGPDAHNESDERFMVDFHTFKKLHPENRHTAITNAVETLSEAEMEGSEPPEEAFYYLLPPQTKGFHLRTKKWQDLNMDQISPVVWLNRTFDSLVLNRKTKELIAALASKQISAAKATDVVAGKGNGLVLLLHGSPGTGKTLTAEGVAEIVKKPLFRVTCGDVGTKAEDVEQYLESVLHLGKIWDCVVLLDEADVFLERRSLDDLQRNALVSVFLRVIEYYEGILILTSNRVGTFDEAFRSRIQIAVHYPPLRSYQRLQVWKNFFDRLESFEDGKVDVDDLRDHLEELGDIEINGHQIRNVITTARQYAEWKEAVMRFEHVEMALEVTGKFNEYSHKLRGGLTDDQIAYEEGIR
ncbi:hypothetical protein PMIN05_000936 [Paraphaeosphaeria minitans]